MTAQISALPILHFGSLLLLPSLVLFRLFPYFKLLHFDVINRT